jgi:hypothetical protein
MYGKTRKRWDECPSVFGLRWHVRVMGGVKIIDTGSQRSLYLYYASDYPTE